jgi:hypothetical protein
MALWLALVCAAQPGPTNPMAASTTTWPTDLEGLAQALGSDALARRGYAARELRRRGYRTARAFSRKRTDPERTFEAKVDLADLRRVAIPACLAELAVHPELVRPCLALVRTVGTSEVAVPLRRIRPELADRHRRLVDRTVAVLEASP